jgi:hypothetical protein
LLLSSCANSKAEPSAPPVEVTPTSAYEIEAFKEDRPPTCAADAGGMDGGEVDAESDASAPDGGSLGAVIAAVRDYLQPCWDDFANQEINGHGRLVAQVWTAPNGDVCSVRTTLRIGLSPGFSACVEKMLRAARFEGVPSPFYLPLTYVVRSADGSLYGHPSRVANIHGCGRSVSEPTEATIAYATDDAGRVGDLAIDPWKGDQKALECAAEAVRTAAHAPSTQFVLHLRYHP